jgi:hypothetical protein
MSGRDSGGGDGTLTPSDFVFFFGAQSAARRMSSSVPTDTFLNAMSVPAVTFSSSSSHHFSGSNPAFPNSSSESVMHHAAPVVQAIVLPVAPRIASANLAVRAIETSSSAPFSSKPDMPVFKFVPECFRALSDAEASKVLDDTLKQYGSTTYTQQHPEFLNKILEFTDATEVGYAQMRFVIQLAKTIDNGCDVLLKSLAKTFYPPVPDDHKTTSVIERIAVLDVVDSYVRAAVGYLKHAMATEPNFDASSLNLKAAQAKKMFRHMFIRLQEIGMEPTKLKLPRLPMTTMTLVNKFVSTPGERIKLRTLQTLQRDLVFGTVSLGMFTSAQELALARKMVPVATHQALICPRALAMAQQDPLYEAEMKLFINRSSFTATSEYVRKGRSSAKQSSSQQQRQDPPSPALSSAMSSTLEAKVNEALLTFATQPIDNNLSNATAAASSASFSSLSSSSLSSATVCMSIDNDPCLSSTDFNVLHESSDVFSSSDNNPALFNLPRIREDDDASNPESNNSGWIGMDDSFLGKLNEEEQLALAIANSDMQALQHESESLWINSPPKRKIVDAFYNPKDITCSAFDEDDQVVELARKLTRSAEEEDATNLETEKRKDSPSQ